MFFTLLIVFKMQKRLAVNKSHPSPAFAVNKQVFHMDFVTFLKQKAQNSRGTQKRKKKGHDKDAKGRNWQALVEACRLR